MIFYLTNWIYLLITLSNLLVCIQVNGQELPMIRFSTSAYQVTEGNSVAVEIQKLGTTTENITVVVMIAPDDENDFASATLPATFPAGGNSVNSVDFFAIDDDIPEGNEVFTMYLMLSQDATNVNLGSMNVANMTIMSNDDPLGIFSILTPSPLLVLEQYTNSTVNVIIERSRGTYGTVNVSYQISGSSRPVEDIYPVTGLVTFSTGESRKSISLTVIADNIPENAEQFTIDLLLVNGTAKLNVSTVSLVIQANDAPVRLEQAQYIVDEGLSVTTLVVNVYRGSLLPGGYTIGSVDRTATLKYRLISETALANSDFQAKKKKVPTATLR